MTWNQEFWTYASVLGICQVLVAIRFYFYLSKTPTFDPSFAPPFSLIVPCKGTGPEFAKNIRSLLHQKYKGALEILLVVPSETDLAFEALQSILKETNASFARILVSNQIPTRCSGKALDLLFALDHVSARSELLAFADSDIRVRNDWLAELTSALADPKTMVATSVMLYIATSRNFWTWMRMINLAACIPYSFLSGWVVGQSFVIRRKDFENLGIREIWGLSLLEDMPVTTRVRESGGTVRYVPQATPISTEACDRRGYFGLFNKWMICVRVYEPFMWVLTFIATFAHFWVAFWCLYPRVHAPILGLLFAGDAAFLAIIFFAFERFFPDRFADVHSSLRPVPFWAALSAPLLWLFCAIQLAQSIVSSDIRWGSRVYRLKGPQNVEVLG